MSHRYSIWRSVDDGQTWSKTKVNWIEHLKFVSKFELAFDDVSKVFYATSVAPEEYKYLWISKDLGASWSQKEMKGFEFASHITISSDGQLAFATNGHGLGLWKNINKMDQWGWSPTKLNSVEKGVWDIGTFSKANNTGIVVYRQNIGDKNRKYFRLAVY